VTEIATPVANNGNYELTYPLEIRKLVQHKRRARRTWHSTRNPTDKTEWNRVSKILHDKIKKMKNETFKLYFSLRQIIPIICYGKPQDL
jgi:hypothetical protein